MNYKEKLPEPLRPLWHPLLVIVFLLGFSWMNYSSAAVVEIPPSPNELKQVRLTIDSVTKFESQSATPGRYKNSYALKTFGRSDEWPGFVFDFHTLGYFVKPQTTYTVYVTEDPQEWMSTYGKAPTYTRTTRVYGVEADGKMITDPFGPYYRNVERKERLLLIARIALVLALPACAFFAWRVRRLLSEL
ncbi:hypothetical protein [Rhizobium sp. 22-785-1]